MMKKTLYTLSLILVFALSACTLYIPPDFGEDYQAYRVILLVEPENADVLLNGRFIGEAYEFSTEKTALRLQSRRNELIIKEKGYVEEVVDLDQFDSRKVTIHLKLKEDKGYARVARERKTEPPSKEKPEYIPKTVKEKEVPEAVEQVTDIEIRLVNLILEIEPEEASIYLNGKFWGISPAKGKIENLRLKPGEYTLEVVKPGYQPYKQQLELEDQKELKISIKLEK